MDREHVQAQLKARRRKGAVVGRLGGLRGLASLLTGGGVPGPIRSLVEDAFSAQEQARYWSFARWRGEIGTHFADYSQSDWSRVIGTFVPHIAASAESAWRILDRRPFQDGLSRRSFRCPRSPRTIADVRGRWLLNITVMLGEYDADIRWIAERAGSLAGWSGGADMGWLLAGAIDQGGKTGDDVLGILRAAASGEVDTAEMGRHVTQALMSCSRPDAWEFVERLLLSAQRQEGLRQAILEAVDESHPDAFRRMLRLIRDENLLRFSSVVRAADTWFGFAWDGSSGVALDSLIERVLLFLDDPSARTAALGESDAETVYLALWSQAFVDVDGAIPPATALLSSPSVEIRFVATHFLVQTLWTTSLPPLVGMLADPDLRVAARALDAFGGEASPFEVEVGHLFDRLEDLMRRLPKRSMTLDAIVWPWWKRKLEKPTIAAAMAANSSSIPVHRLLPYVPDLDPTGRAAFVQRVAGLAPRWERAKKPGRRREITPAERGMLLDLLGDASADVRTDVFESIEGLPVQADEVERLVELLGRKPGDLRTGCLARLRGLPDPQLLAAAELLLADSSDLRRLAGLELLRDAAERRRSPAEVRSLVTRYASEHPTLTEEERAHVTAVLGDEGETVTTDDSLGLIDPASLRVWPVPRARHVDLATTGARESLKALAELITAHQETEIRSPSGETRMLVESVPWIIGPRKVDEPGEATETVPLDAVWRQWVQNRPPALRDSDGLELLRALMGKGRAAPWEAAPVQAVCALGQYRAGSEFLRGVLEWCAVWDPPKGGIAFLLDGLEASIADFATSDFEELAKAVKEKTDERNYFRPGDKPPAFRVKMDTAMTWLGRARWWRDLFPGEVQATHAERLFGLVRAFEARAGGTRGFRFGIADVVAASRAGVVGEAELTDLLVGRWSYRSHGSLLREMSPRKTPRALLDHPEILAVVDRCRRRVVEVESTRGDRESAASGLAMELRWTGGLETLARALPALGKTHFARTFGWSGSTRSRQETLSHLIVRSIPGEEDTPEAFAGWAREAGIKEARLVEVAVYAPQWAAHVNHVLQWPGLEGAVWWIQAHTKDDRSWQLQEMKEIWAAEVSERTPLSAADLTEGAVDVGWFATVYGALGEERWKKLDTAAKYAASSAGHTRAQLFARAMAGLVTRNEILARIEESRHQDSVRALGLLPLGPEPQRDLLERYTRLQRFRREARKFGSQRQQSEGRAVAIGLANLARTAGFRDPQRLQWAMEQQAVADLKLGPVVLERDEVRLQLSVDVDGVPSLGITKNGKALKALPAALKKDDAVEELRDRLQELKRQRSRVRDALEEAMCRGDRFGSDELRTLLDHPILAPALSRLVFVGDDVAGYLDEGGRVLRDPSGGQHALGNREEVRIAHPHDLFTRGDWSAWQRDCFRAERVQPFKQLFRELYPTTDAERDASRSSRYAGHQVNPRQALALLGGRGWVARPEEGVSRTFHEDGLTARLAFEEAFYTPADVEGLTLDEVIFTRKGEWKEIPLRDIPPRLFSETMRDLDLVVSVAHRGGVDPEATASTVEMRGALVQETCQLLGLGNVELKTNHAIVRGDLGTYSVHLGSAGVSLMPGAALPIVAVHSQHRGRLFLPFADDDPRTAEVLSKVLLLARDREIRDPRILEWIRAARQGVTT